MSAFVWATLGYSLPLAIGIALSPVTVITSTVLLRTERGRAKAGIFALCWFVAILVIAGIAYNVVGGADSAAPDQTETGVDILQLALAALFLALALISWLRRRRSDSERVTALLRRLDNIGMLGSAGLGLAQGFVRVRNFTLAVGAGALFGDAGLNGAAAAAPLAVFALVSSAGVLVPLIFAIVGGDRASAGLTRTRQWLEANMNPITTVVLVVVGLYFLGRGLAILG